MGMILLERGEHFLELIVVMVAQLYKILKSITWYTLSRLIAWYMNYVSIKLLLEKQEGEGGGEEKVIHQRREMMIFR